MQKVKNPVEYTKGEKTPIGKLLHLLLLPLLNYDSLHLTITLTTFNPNRCNLPQIGAIQKNKSVKSQ
jgi:hypothetical protein